MSSYLLIVLIRPSLASPSDPHRVLDLATTDADVAEHEIVEPHEMPGGATDAILRRDT
jgi:hypothetical protein